MLIDAERKEHALLVRLQGELDHHSAEQVRLLVDRELGKKGACNLILNLRGLTFMDSSGIGVILGRYRYLERLGRRMALCNVPKTVRKVLDISGVPKIIPVLTSEAAALVCLSGEKGEV